MGKLFGHLKNQGGTVVIALVIVGLVGWIGFLTTKWVDSENELIEMHKHQIEHCVDQNTTQCVICGKEGK